MMAPDAPGKRKRIMIKIKSTIRIMDGWASQEDVNGYEKRTVYREL